MPPKHHNGNIKDFFKPFTIPKNRIPRQDVIDEEIIVASAPPKPPAPTVSPTKQDKRRKQSPASRTVSTPTERARRASSNHGSDIGQLDGADDTPVQVPSPTAQQRQMSAVEIRSPPARSPTAPPQFQFNTGAPSTTTSFSSISTLSSVPLSSQSSSKRIVRNGLQAVTNSDSGSDDTESSDELADVTSFVPRKRRKMTPPGKDRDHAIEIPNTIKPSRRSVRLLDEDQRANTPRTLLSPPRTAYKHSLSNMIKQQRKAEKIEARIKAVETAFEDAVKKREEDVKGEGGLAGGLEAALADDSDEGERMKLAIARTEALQDTQKFYFFHGPKPAARGALEIPPITLKRHVYHLDSEEAKVQAFLSGHLAHLVEAQIEREEDFPDSFYDWIALQLTHEPRDDLCEAYAEVLRVRSSRAWNRRLCLSTFYCVYNGTSMDDKPDSETTEREDRSVSVGPQISGRPHGLRHVLRVVRNCITAPTKDSVTVHTAISELVLALLDDHVNQDSSLRNDIQDTIEHVVDSCLDDNTFTSLCRACSSLLLAKSLPLKLRCEAIASLPASSERCHRLRRLLSIDLITDRADATDFADDLSSAQLADSILQQVKTRPEFAISESANYAQLTWLVAVLDFAIDMGFSEFSSQSRYSMSSKPKGPFERSAATSTAETEFNAQVDAFTVQLRQMSSRIRDIGTSHLRRTEAKSAIDRLVLRLEYCVRTRPKAKKGVFGDATGLQRDFLSGFLKQSTAESDYASVVPAELLSDRQVDFEIDLSDDSTAAGAEDVSM